MKYRKLPVVIDAVRWMGDNLDECCTFLGDSHHGHYGDTLVIDTLEGEMPAPPGHWLIRGVKGEHYSCEDSIFRLTYEPVEDAT